MLMWCHKVALLTQIPLSLIETIKEVERTTESEIEKEDSFDWSKTVVLTRRCFHNDWRKTVTTRNQDSPDAEKGVSRKIIENDRIFRRPIDPEGYTYQSSDPERCTYQSRNPEGHRTYKSSGSVERTHQSRDLEGFTYQSSDPEGYTYQSSDPEGYTYQSSDPEGCTYQSSDPKGYTYHLQDQRSTTVEGPPSAAWRTMRRRAAGRRQTRSDEGRTTVSGCVRPRGRSEMDGAATN
ncbi:NBS-LRR type resistance protein [Cucumis melo var. makuwa]|uniref:NBS-LRR type resistance protein n=1 Tax=Cucumis melo var. makuwa TaxID=1194695 RepID=A0A5A7SPB4_CUCMM|nr:NBS-LRR type resistance protein [Cucumis melo var. makuwa]TYK31650.1 NBS-LRR type resistance protein [Cucumis melo var. makuwa]